MTIIPIPSGPTNREIIDRAWQVVGVSDAMFGRTPEEYATGILALGGMMLEWPYDLLGFDIEDAAGLRVEQESGIERKWLDAVAHGLAERIASAIGRPLPPLTMKTKAVLYSRLCSLQTIPDYQRAPGTFYGAGQRRPGGLAIVDSTDDCGEIITVPIDIDSLPVAP